jgi:hypothetical protein
MEVVIVAAKTAPFWQYPNSIVESKAPHNSYAI